MINEERLIYSIIREIHINNNKIYSDENNNGMVLDPEKTGNKFIYMLVIKEIENKYIIRKTEYSPLNVLFRDITTEGYNYLQLHNEFNNDYPGWFSEKFIEWLNEP